MSLFLMSMTTERECTKSKEEPLAWDHVIRGGKQH